MSVDNEVLRATRRQDALLRARLRLKQRLESIDYDLDVVLPARQALKERAAQGELTETTIAIEGLE